MMNHQPSLIHNNLQFYTPLPKRNPSSPTHGAHQPPPAATSRHQPSPAITRPPRQKLQCSVPLTATAADRGVPSDHAGGDTAAGHPGAAELPCALLVSWLGVSPAPTDPWRKHGETQHESWDKSKKVPKNCWVPSVDVSPLGTWYTGTSGWLETVSRSTGGSTCPNVM